MSLNLTNLFGQLAPVIAASIDVNTFRGTTIANDVGDIYSEYLATGSEATIDGWLNNLYQYQSSSGSILSQLQTLASTTVTTDVNAWQAQANRSLGLALFALVDQMVVQGATVLNCTVGNSVATISGSVGNPQFVVSCKTALGYATENQFAETITGVVTNDAYSGSAVAGNETVTFAGQAAQSNSLSWLWPAGSGSSLALNLINGATSVGNLVTNGGFETWTVPNVPTGWTIVTGTAGTQVVRENVPYTGTYSLGLVGDGTTQTTLRMPVSVSANTQYSFNCWVKVNTAPAAGVLAFSLVDGSGTVLNDFAGNPNTVTLNLTGSTTTYTPFNGTFRINGTPPATVNLQIKLSSALSVSTTAYIDVLGFGRMSQFYQGGPWVNGYSGNTQCVTGDGYTVTTTNDQAGVFQRNFARLFNTPQLQLLLPSSASPTIAY